MREWLSEAEIDAVMANVHPSSRRWCVVADGCGCACIGCIAGMLTQDEFSAWQEREKNREPTLYVAPSEPVRLTLQQRLESYKARKRAADSAGEQQ